MRNMSYETQDKVNTVYEDTVFPEESLRVTQMWS